jgi:CTP:molybdopterin cytidylyltransferase MocA
VTVAAVILAAGAGTRFNRSDHAAGPGAKLLFPLRGRPMVRWVIDSAAHADLDEVVVVAGAADLEGVVPSDVTLLRNGAWATGQASSLRCALEWCADRGHDRAVVGLGDQPGLTSEAWREVARAPGGPIVFATYDGRRGHPVGLDAEVWHRLPVSGEEGARELARRHPELVDEVACTGSPDDIDSPEDVTPWS